MHSTQTTLMHWHQGAFSKLQLAVADSGQISLVFGLAILVSILVPIPCPVPFTLKKHDSYTHLDP